jgi:hypothetical protein
MIDNHVSKIQVYHAIKPTYGFGEAPGWPEEYVQVAEVDTTDLDEAFKLTNHISKPWWENEKVTVVGLERDPDGRGKHRSTSVGDVLVKTGVTDAEDEVYRCANFGWTRINPHNGAPL